METPNNSDKKEETGKRSVLVNQMSRESIIEAFEKTTDLTKMKEEYSRLWYEKLAL